MNAQTDNAPEMEARRKISSRTVMGKIKKEWITAKATPLFQVIGQAYGTREGNSDYGKWTALVGTFEAVNLITGEIFAAPECFLPEPFNGMLAGKLNGASKVNAVDFAYEIGVKEPGPDATVQYEYTCKPIHDPTAGDPLKALRARIPKFAALAPPEKDGDEKDEDKKKRR
jgi:hypothetical protein